MEMLRFALCCLLIRTTLFSIIIIYSINCSLFVYNMGKFHCDVCGKYSNNLHQFSQYDRPSKQWAEALGWLEEFKEELAKGKQSKSFFLCDDHFDHDQYKPGSKHLKTGAMPSYYHRPQSGPPKLQAFTTIDHDIVEEEEEIIDPKKREVEDKTSKKDSYVLLSLECLKDLVRAAGCVNCGNINVERSLRKEGTTAIVDFISCKQCNKKSQWTSTKKVTDIGKRSVFQGNLDFITATNINGIPWDRMEDFGRTLNLLIPRRASYFDWVNRLVMPVVEDKYLGCMRETMEVVKDKNTFNSHTSKYEVVLAGDGQYDSRGYSAEFCRYTLMDTKTKLVVGHELVDKGQTDNKSPPMEAFGCRKVLEEMEKNTDFTVKEFVTDAHKETTKLMATKFAHIKHRDDQWHFMKGVSKKGLAKMNNKEMNKKKYRQAFKKFITHVYNSIKEAGEDKDLLEEMVKSSWYHMQGIHNFTGQHNFKKFDKCPRHVQRNNVNPRDQKEKLMDARNADDQQFLDIIRSIVTDPSVLKELRRVSPTGTTTGLELFHSLGGEIYMVKNDFYPRKGHEHRYKLTIMHQNYHRMDIIANDAVLASGGETQPKRYKWSTPQNQMTLVTNNPKPENWWKQEIVELVREKYCAMKDDEVAAQAARDPNELPRNIRKKKRLTEEAFWEQMDEVLQMIDEDDDFDVLDALLIHE